MQQRGERLIWNMSRHHEIVRSLPDLNGVLHRARSAVEADDVAKFEMCGALLVLSYEKDHEDHLHLGVAHRFNGGLFVSDSDSGCMPAETFIATYNENDVVCLGMLFKVSKSLCC